jgi:phage terminase large subunit-like protein
MPAEDWLDVADAGARAEERLAQFALAPRRLHALWDVLAPAGVGNPPGEWQRDLMKRLERFTRAVERQESPRLMVFAPPQFGKSDIVSRLYPAWVLGKHPDWALLAASYGNDLATRSSRWVRNQVQGELWPDLFPGCRLRGDIAAAGHMETDAGGILRAISVRTGSGWPGRIAIVDDPFADRSAASSDAEQKAVWDWYVSTIAQRMSPGGGILIMHTRWAQGDLAGRLLQKAAEEPDADQWEVAIYPHCGWRTGDPSDMTDVLHPERVGREKAIAIAKSKRASMGEFEWSAIHQQNPMPEGGLYFDPDKLQTYEAHTPPVVGEVHVALDLALRQKAANDRSVGAAFGLSEAGDLIFLPGAFAGRMHPEEAIDNALDLCERYNVRGYLCVGHDHIAGSLDKHIEREIERRHLLVQVHDVPEVGDKPTKARGYQAFQRKGRVWWADEAVWRDIIRPEHMHFPGGIHDDSIDMAFHAVHLIDVVLRAQAARVVDQGHVQPKRWAETIARAARPTGSSLPPGVTNLFGQRGRLM